MDLNILMQLVMVIDRAIMMMDRVIVGLLIKCNWFLKVNNSFSRRTM